MISDSGYSITVMIYGIYNITSFFGMALTVYNEHEKRLLISIL